MTVLKEQICPKYSGSTHGRTCEEGEEEEEEQEKEEKKNACGSQILPEVQDLGHLDSAHTAPIRRVETASLGPTSDMIRNCLVNMFFV